MNIDKKLDEFIRNGCVLKLDNGQPYIFVSDEAVTAIKQLFQELIDEVIGSPLVKDNSYIPSSNDPYGKRILEEQSRSFTKLKKEIISEESYITIRMQRQRAKELLEEL